jgi:DNA-binding transcriptional ArsR family regulator
MDDRTLVKVFKALADAKRFRMLREVAATGELSCGQLAGRFKLSQPTVSHHLKLLAEAGLLRMRRQAQHRFISVNRKLVKEALSSLPARLKRGR